MHFAFVFAVTKSSKPGIAPFQSRGTLIHTPRTRWLCPGCLLRKPPDGIDRRRTSVGRIRFRSGFSEGLQRFNAGWSSPVARQAHNLKVIGSNPIPATNIFNSLARKSAGFVFAVVTAGAKNRGNASSSKAWRFAKISRHSISSNPMIAKHGLTARALIGSPAGQRSSRRRAICRRSRHRPLRTFH